MEAKIITILNKLPRKDSITGLDIWYKTVLHDIPYKVEKITGIDNNNVTLGQTFSVLFPFNTIYKEYESWILAPDSGYTLSRGDYIFIGVDIQEDITPNNIVAIKNKYAQCVCEIKTITEVPRRIGVNYQFKIEGV